jgi:Protein of unknown function (DUF2939)
MKRILSLLIVAAALFYIAWPAYSGVAIKAALDGRDASGLRERVDFDAVRDSMRPAITTKVETALDAAAEKAGPSAAKIYAALKTQMMPKIVEASLQRIVTPETLIRVHAERGTIKDIMNKMIGDQVSNSGGSGGALGALASAFAGTGAGSGAEKPDRFDAGKLIGGLFGAKGNNAAEAPPVDASGPAKSSVTWRNIRGAGLDGPLGVYVRLSKDPAATEPDITATMSFRGSGWVLTGLEPRL